MQSSRKGREAIRSVPFTLGGNTRGGKGSHRLRDAPWGVSGSNHILGTSALWWDPGKESPLSWFENQ